MAYVLILEPDGLLARTYGQALQHVGHTVAMCATAQEAVFAADEQLPHLVVLELQLVAHSGIEFLYEFRSYTDWLEVPVVIVSMVPPAELTQFRPVLDEQLGVQAYYYKPATSLDRLVRLVEKYAKNPAIDLKRI